MDVLLLHIDEMKTLELSKGRENFCQNSALVIAMGSTWGCGSKGFHPAHGADVAGDFNVVNVLLKVSVA